MYMCIYNLFIYNLILHFISFYSILFYFLVPARSTCDVFAVYF